GADAVVLGECEHAEDPADAERAVVRVDQGAELADRTAGAVRAGKELPSLGRRAPRAIGGGDRVLPARLPAMLAQELARARIEEADALPVPLHGEALAEMPGRRAVVRPVDFDAAVEVHHPGAVLIVAK